MTPPTRSVQDVLDRVPIGYEVRIVRTVTEDDVARYAEITGDFARHHVDARYAAGTRFGRRIVHGTLLLGYTSAASTRRMAELGGHCVTAGYDRVRFLRPVHIGDEITVSYVVERVDVERARAFAAIRVLNQDGLLCMTATHISAYLEEPGHE